MNKVLVEVYVPAASEKFDAYIPVESKISEVAILLSNAAADLLENKYKVNRFAAICDFTTGKEFDKNSRIFQTSIDNGSKIMIT